jgi:VanZ family protein
VTSVKLCIPAPAPFEDEGLLRFLGVSFLLAVASLVPGDLRLSSVLDDHVEHLLAYWVAGIILQISFRHPRFAWRRAVVNLLALTVLAGGLEAAQALSRTRTPGILDFAAGAAGALAGVATGLALSWLLHKFFS